MNEQKITESLLAEGYDKAYIWDAEPGESDPSHDHLFDTKLMILAGNISIEMDGQTTILEKGDTLTIPRKKLTPLKLDSRVANT